MNGNSALVSPMRRHGVGIYVRSCYGADDCWSAQRLQERLKLASSRQNFSRKLISKVKEGVGLVVKGECDFSVLKYDLK